MKKLWKKITSSKLYAKIAIVVLSIAVVALAIASVIFYALSKRSSGNTSTVNIEQHKRDLEAKIETWQNYIDNTKPVNRR